MPSSRAAVRIEGLEETIARLQALPEATRSIVGGYIQSAARTIEQQAKQRAPRGKTGNLQASIGMEVRSDGLRASVGSGVHYAKFVELGTSTRPAKPFLYPALKAGGRELRKNVRNTVEDLGKVRFKTKRFKPKAQP